MNSWFCYFIIYKESSKNQNTNFQDKFLYTSKENIYRIQQKIEIPFHPGLTKKEIPCSKLVTTIGTAEIRTGNKNINDPIS